MVMIEGMILVLLLGGGNNIGDLLDFTPTEAYWEMRDQRVVDLDTMAAVLAEDDVTATDTLMAIRVIGELMKVDEDADPDKPVDPAAQAKAIKLLTPYVGSEEPFVDQYAKRSIAWVKGEEPPSRAPLATQTYDLDLALLPKDATIVGQMKMTNGVGPLDLAGMIPDIKIDGQSIRDEMMKEMLPGLLEAVKMVGNARADLVTVGVVVNNKEDVSLMLVVRGQYDRVGVQVALEDAMGDDEDASFYSVGDIEVVAVKGFSPVAMLMPSDELFIALFAPGRGAKLPIDAVAKELGQADRKPTFDETLSKQVAAIPRDKATIWAAMKVTPLMKQERGMAEVFGAFDAARAFAVRDAKGLLDIQWVGQGNDAAVVKKTTDFFTESIKEGIVEIKEEKQRMPKEMQVMMDPIVTMMESMKFNAQGKTMTGGMKVDPSIGMSMPMMMFGMQVRAVQNDEAALVAVEEAVEEAVPE